VLRGGAGERAGVSPGDEVLAIAGWRVRRLDEALRVIEPGAAAEWLVARDQRVLALKLALPPPDAALNAGGVSLRLAAKPAKAVQALRKAWLQV